MISNQHKQINRLTKLFRHIKKIKMILLLTHSTRKIDFNQCHLNFLTNRYKNKKRLHNLPELSTLSNEYCSNYTGAFSCWDWSIISENPKLIHWGKKHYKVQQAQIRGYKMLAGSMMRYICVPLAIKTLSSFGISIKINLFGK